MDDKIIIAKDKRRISIITADLTTVCDLINAAIKKMHSQYLIAVEIDDEIVRELSMGDGSKLKNALISGVRSGMSKFLHNAMPFLAQNKTAQECERAMAEIDDIIYNLDEKIKISRKFQRLSPYSYIHLLHAINGYATFSPKEVEDICTTYASGAALEYVNKAKDLHSAIVEFDRITRILSNGAVRGITDEQDYETGVIEIVDGVIWLDLSRVAMLDFEDMESRLANAQIISKSKIVAPDF